MDFQYNPSVNVLQIFIFSHLGNILDEYINFDMDLRRFKGNKMAEAEDFSKFFFDSCALLQSKRDQGPRKDTTCA